MFNFLKKFKKEKEVDPEVLRLSNHIDTIITQNDIYRLIEEAKRNNCTYLEFALFLKKDVSDKPAYTYSKLQTTHLERHKMFLNYGDDTDDSNITDQETYLCAYTTINVSPKIFEQRSEWPSQTNLWKSISKIINERYKNTDLFLEMDWDLDDEFDNIDYLSKALEIKDLRSTFNCRNNGLFYIPCVSIILEANENNQW
ncbi:hypothetical protein R9X47_11375 [Wukongibacter baidiensis]|uniref:hypothetical protein n=1 Tax=Wukongibacter baidiensis TaxID=1723361 RepID=UPI003D7F55BE